MLLRLNAVAATVGEAVGTFARLVTNLANIPCGAKSHAISTFANHGFILVHKGALIKLSLTQRCELLLHGEPVPATPPFGPPFSSVSALPQSSVEPQSRSCAFSGLIVSICRVSSALSLESWEMDFSATFCGGQKRA